LGDSGPLLTDSDVHTVQLGILIVPIVPSLLVEDGIEGHSSLAGLTITNDQLTLATANWHHGIDGLETSLHRLVDGTTRQDAGSLDRGTATFSSLDRPLAIDGVAESVDDTAEKAWSDRDIDDLTSTLDGITFLDETIVTEDGDTDVVGLQVQTHAADTRRELHHLLYKTMMSPTVLYTFDPSVLTGYSKEIGICKIG
jgi:hypothetical protein